MCKLKTVLGINVALFSVIGLIHLFRVILGWPMQFANWNVPVWLSGVGLVVAGVLVYFNAKHL